jgi:toxin HigB-1
MRAAKIRRIDVGDTEHIWRGQQSRKFPGDVQERALRKLRQFDASLILEDLRNPPGNHLEALRADRPGQWSIRINERWRICFRWSDGDAHDVEIVDYH